MSKYLVIIAFAISAVAIAQRKATLRDTSIKPLSSDTIYASKKDSITIPPELAKNRELRIMFEEKNSIDYFKYIFPIVTLLLGIAINKYLDHLKVKKSIREAGERWKAELAILEKPLSKQIEHLKAFLEEHNKDYLAKPKLTMMEALECEIFNSLDKSLLHKYILGLKANNYKDSILLLGKITYFISILKNNNDNLRKKFNEYLEQTSALTSKLNISLQELLKEFGNYSLEIEQETNGNPTTHAGFNNLLHLMNTQIMPKKEKGDYEIFDLQRKFFFPFLDELGRLRSDERTRKMIDIVGGAINTIKGIKMEKTYLSENMKSIISTYNENESLLTEIMVEFTS
jgi:hypothetical protein